MIRAILDFDNIASTWDICEMFSYLFKKGIYYGGSMVGSSTGTITIEPFRLLSKDGMHVLSDTKVYVQLPGKGSYTIVCRARYGETALTEIKALTDSELDADGLKDYCVYFGRVTWEASGNVTITTAGIKDVIEPIGGKSSV